MRYKKFLGYDISVLGFGGIPIMSGRVSDFLVKLKDVAYRDSIETIEYAINQGVNFFDTAIDYGDSEIKIGEVTRPYRNDIFLASKSKALSYDAMMFDVETSLKRLQTDYIDLYQFHFVKDINAYNEIMGEKGSFRALLHLKESKVIRHIGLASHNALVLNSAIKSKLVDTIQLPFNIIENENLKIIKLIKESNIESIIMKPYAGGALTTLTEKTSKIVKNDAELRELALKFVLKYDPGIIIPGMATINEVKNNIDIVNNFNKLTQDEIYKIQCLKEIIGTTFCRRCQYCEPCPKNIQIAQIIRFYKYYEDYGLHDWAVKQYRELNVLANKCVNCGQCEKKCPYNIPIRKTLKRIHDILGEKNNGN